MPKVQIIACAAKDQVYPGMSELAFESLGVLLMKDSGGTRVLHRDISKGRNYLMLRPICL